MFSSHRCLIQPIVLEVRAKTIATALASVHCCVKLEMEEDASDVFCQMASSHATNSCTGHIVLLLVST